MSRLRCGTQNNNGSSNGSNLGGGGSSGGGSNADEGSPDIEFANDEEDDDVDEEYDDCVDGLGQRAASEPNDCCGDDAEGHRGAAAAENF